MASLFISYSRKDFEVARKLTEAFNGQGLDFWIDWAGIPPTVDWWNEIQKGIEEADIFLFLLSPDSVQSKVCKQEVEHAVKNGKRLIPLVVRDIKAGESPVELGSLNWIFCRADDDFNLALNKLISAVQTDYDWVQAHRQLQVKALEWQRNNYETSLFLRGKELQAAELELTANSSNEPHPTDLQREYVLKSRQASDRQRGIVSVIAVAVVIALAVLAVFGFVQAGRATTNAKNEQAASTLAVSNASTAQAASTLAISNAATAVANEAEAKRQTNIAIARQLAAQAQSIIATGNSKQMMAVLLAIQSMKMYPSIEAAQILENNTLARPIANLPHSGFVEAIAFSPDGKYLATGCTDGLARVWDVSTGKEIAHIAHNDHEYILSIAFSPDSKYVISGSSDKTAKVWEAASGREIAHMTHDDLVIAVAFSPDGKYVASGSWDNTVRVWEAMTGKEISHMTHDGPVQALAISPDGKYVISGSTDNTARIWDVNSGNEIARLIHESAVHAVTFSSDGKYVATGSFLFIARVWKIATGKEIARLPFGGTVTSIAFSPDGKYVVSGSADSTARVWDATSGQEIARMTHDYNVNAVAFSPDGKYVVSGSSDDTARVWDATTGKEIARVTHDGAVNVVAFSPDGKYLVSGGEDKSARVWEASGRKEIARMTHSALIWSVNFSPDSKYVVSSGNDNTSRVWEAATGIEVTRMTYPSRVQDAVFSSDGKYIVSGGCDQPDPTSPAICAQGSARVWDAMTGNEIARMTHAGSVLSVAFSPDGKYVISGGCKQIGTTNELFCPQGIARVWEAATGKEISQMIYDGAVTAVAFSPNGDYVVAGSSDNTARVWDAISGQEISRMTHKSWVACVAFSPDGKYVVSGGRDRTARVWEVATGKEIANMVHGNEVFSVAFSPDGKYVVSGGQDKTARVWEATTGIEVARMTHNNTVYSVAFSPDGKYVVSASRDNTARVWEAATGREVARVNHDDWVSSASFSPDGKYVVSGSADQTARVWIWQPADLILNGCSYLSRNLSKSEWKQYLYDAIQYESICRNLPADPTYLKYITEQALLDTHHPNRVQAAINTVNNFLKENSDTKNLEDQAIQVVKDTVESQLLDVFNRDLDTSSINWYLSLLKEANKVGFQIPIDPRIPTKIAQQILNNPNDPNRVQLALDKVRQMLNKYSNSDHVSRDASQIVTGAIVDQIDVDFAAGNPESFELLQEASKIGLEMQDAEQLNSLCWSGSLYGYAKDVLHYCEQAVTLEPNNENFRDSRGLARALTGNFEGAILDFQYFVDHSTLSDYITERQQWIKDLQENKNPFISEVMDKLRQE